MEKRFKPQGKDDHSADIIDTEKNKVICNVKNWTEAAVILLCLNAGIDLISAVFRPSITLPDDIQLSRYPFE